VVKLNYFEHILQKVFEETKLQ